MKLTHNDLKELCNQCDSAMEKLDIIAEYGNKAEKGIIALILNNSKNKRDRITAINSLVDSDYLNDSDFIELRKFIKNTHDYPDETNYIINNNQSLPSNKRKTTEELIKENKSKGIACCPKCGSTSITTTDKKLSITRGIVGGAILGPIGAGVGALTSKKIYCVCLTCGHRWKI